MQCGAMQGSAGQGRAGHGPRPSSDSENAERSRHGVFGSSGMWCLRMRGLDVDLATISPTIISNKNSSSQIILGGIINMSPFEY